MKHRQRTISSAFTFTELLVVIGVIAVLIALSLPVLSAVRESSRRSACAANLATCWKGFELYASTNRGLVPRGHIRGSAPHPQWTALVAKSSGLAMPFTWTDVSNYPPLHCPSHPTDGVASHFVVNAFAGDASNSVAGMTNLSSLHYPSTLPWLLETPPEFGRMTFMPFDDIFMEEARFVSTADHLPGGSSVRVGSNNHGKRKSNVLFADGHVEVRNTQEIKLAEYRSERP